MMETALVFDLNGKTIYWERWHDGLPKPYCIYGKAFPIHYRIR